MPTDHLVIRPAGPEDLPAVAAVHLAARQAAVPAMPPLVRAPEEVRGFLERLDLRQRALWVAEAGEVVGYAQLEGDWLEDLYVHPGAQGRAVGSALLDLVKSQRPDGFCLWVFASNEAARRFYRRHGLVELETTNGSGNEERAPDVRMAWPGRDPLGFLRGLIDDVDDQLGDLLARRLALTRAVQAHKAGRGRDLRREREIAARVAQRAPELGEERVALILDAIITASLEAAGRDD